MNVSTTTAAYANYQNNYKTGTAIRKRNSTNNRKYEIKAYVNTTDKGIAGKPVKRHKNAENLRSRNDMDFMVADFENGRIMPKIFSPK